MKTVNDCIMFTMPKCGIDLSLPEYSDYFISQKQKSASGCSNSMSDQEQASEAHFGRSPESASPKQASKQASKPLFIIKACSYPTEVFPVTISAKVQTFKTQIHCALKSPLLSVLLKHRFLVISSRISVHMDTFLH